MFARETPYQIRDHARYTTQGIRCNHGQVQDLSGSGMRFRVSGKPGFSRGDLLRFVVESNAQKLNLTGRVVWIRRCGLLSREHECGVRFADLKPSHARAIEEFALNGFIEDRKEGAPSPQRASVRVEVPDLYAMLGVDRAATEDEIHSAFRRLAKELHPDANPDEQAAERFTQVSKAYRVLHDPDSRARYDRMLAEAA